MVDAVKNNKVAIISSLITAVIVVGLGAVGVSEECSGQLIKLIPFIAG